MRLEQTFGGTRPNLSFTTTWVKRRVVVEWPAAGPTEHVNAIKYNYASTCAPRCGDQIVHPVRHQLGPEPGIVWGIHAVVNCRRTLSRLSTEYRISGVSLDHFSALRRARG